MSLIAWYPLNGDTKDYSGNNNHLTYLYNNGLLIETSNGKIGKAYERTLVNTTADHFRATNQIYAPGDMTIACWAKVSAVHSGTANGLISNHSHVTNSGLGLNVKEISSTDYRISCSTGSGTSRTYMDYYGTSNIKDTWSHLLLRCIKSTNTLTLWVNGLIEWSGNYSQYNKLDFLDIFNWSTSHNSVASYRPKCILNDVRIYDHALSEKEIKEIAKAKILHYTFDQYVNPNGGTITDNSGFRNNAILTEATTPQWVSDSKIGSGAYKFNGSKYIQYSNTFGLVAANQEWTVCGWIKMDDDTTNQQLNNFNSGNYLKFGASNSLLYLNSGANDYYTYGTNISSANWHHVAFVFKNSTGLRKIYCDGIDISTSGPNRTSTPSGISSTVQIGGNFRGLLADYQVYANALSASDILELYQTRASIDSIGNLLINQIVEDIEPTINLAPYTDYSNRNYGVAYDINGWGGDDADVYYYPNGGFNNLPYKKMVKHTGGTGGSFINEHQYFTLIEGKTYSVSCYMKANRAITLNGHEIALNRNADNAYYVPTGSNLTTDWTRIKWNFNCGVGQGGTTFNFRQIIYIDDNLPLEVYWCGLQVEEKTSPTPYIKNIRSQSESLSSSFIYGNSIKQEGIASFDTISELGITNGLIAYYPFDKDARDYSGNRNHGTINGTVLSNGIKGQSYNFPSGTAIICNGALTGVYNNQKFSWGAWINMSSSSYRILMSTINRLELNAGSRLGLSMNGSDGWTSVSGSTTLNYNTWYHVFATYENGVGKIYVNGNLDGTLNKTNFLGCGSNLIIGNWTNLTQSFVGSIDEVRIYNRALSAEEVSILYETTAPSTAAMKITKDTVYVKNEFKEVI